MHTRVQCVRERVRGSREGRRVRGECVQVCTCVRGRLSGGAPARWDPNGQGSGGEQGQRSLCSEGTRIPLGQLGPPRDLHWQPRPPGRHPPACGVLSPAAPVLPYPGSQEDTGTQGRLPKRSEPRGLHSAEATGPGVSLRSPALQGAGLVPLSPAAARRQRPGIKVPMGSSSPLWPYFSNNRKWAVGGKRGSPGALQPQGPRSDTMSPDMNVHLGAQTPGQRTLAFCAVLWAVCGAH